MEYWIVSHPALFTACYCAAGLAVWFFVVTLEYGYYSNQLSCHSSRFALRCFWGDLLCRLPGGRKRRMEFVRRIRGFDDPAMLARYGVFTYREMLKKGFREEAFWKMSGGRTVFYCSHLFCFAAWPIIVLTVVIVWSVSFLEAIFTAVIARPKRAAKLPAQSEGR